MNGRRQKSIKITEVDEDSIIQHILPLSELSINNKKKKNDAPKQQLFYSPSCRDKPKKGYAERYSSDSDNDENAMSVQATSTHDSEIEDDVIHGGDLFKFKTIKRSGQMALKASEVASPKTPKTPKQNKNTPQKSSKQTPKQAAPSTPTKDPESNSGSRTHTRMEASTPYRLRKRHQELEEDDSSSDNSVDESEEEEDENEDTEIGQSTLGRQTGSDMTSSAEAYFDLHSMAPITSDRTLASLEGPRMDVAAVREALRNVDDGHNKERKRIQEQHESYFNKWMLQMCRGYNILLYGLGSKRSLIDSLRCRHMSKFSNVVVNGYFPCLTIKHILSAITEEILGETRSFSNPVAHIKFIKDSFTERDMDWFLLINNIDGLLLRSDKAQALLSHLAETPGCHIVASIDHINAPFLWDQNKCFRFRWLWYETATFQPYESENAYENSLLVQQSGALALSSILHVMHSLTPNGRKVFLLLAHYQLDQCGNSTYIGMSFQQLYQECREAFLVNSDLTLQAQLVEFRDHRLIRSRKNFEGVEHLMIPIDKNTLTEFLAEYKETSG